MLHAGTTQIGSMHGKQGAARPGSQTARECCTNGLGSIAWGRSVGGVGAELRSGSAALRCAPQLVVERVLAAERASGSAGADRTASAARSHPVVHRLVDPTHPTYGTYLVTHSPTHLLCGCFAQRTWQRGSLSPAQARPRRLRRHARSSKRRPRGWLRRARPQRPSQRSRSSGGGSALRELLQRSEMSQTHINSPGAT